MLTHSWLLFCLWILVLLSLSFLDNIRFKFLWCLGVLHGCAHQYLTSEEPVDTESHYGWDAKGPLGPWPNSCSSRITQNRVPRLCPGGFWGFKRKRVDSLSEKYLNFLLTEFQHKARVFSHLSNWEKYFAQSLILQATVTTVHLFLVDTFWLF